MLVFSHLVEKMFENRGYTKGFLNTLDQFDPSERLLGSDLFCQRLREIRMDASSPLVVFYPDFDTDGIMSGVLGFAGLAELGFNVALYAPQPSDGYGFGAETIDKIMTAYPGARILITADNGVTCFDGIQRAKEVGLEVLITDHHKPSAQGLPDADLVIDPMRDDDSYSMPYICGANVIYQLLQDYADRYCDNQVRAQIRRLRVFAGIGTISDAMPLLSRNRQLVRDAVSVCRLIYSNSSDYVVSNLQGSPVYCSAFWGLWHVLKVFEQAGKISENKDIDEGFFGFYLAPMFNSVKRMDGSMMQAFGLFFGMDKETDANYLYSLNEARKSAVADALSVIESSDNPMAPYVYITTASKGVVGLLATRLMDVMKGPCLVLVQEDDGHYVGSGRSPAWYPFLTRTMSAGVWAAGHENAFGVRFDDDASLQAYLDWLDSDLQQAMSGVDLESFLLKPDFCISTMGDGDIGLDIVSFYEFIEELNRFKPFGVGFEEPSILMKFRPEDAQWTTIGSMKQHLKLILPYGIEVLVWNEADKINRKDSGKTISLMGKLVENEFRGQTTIQFIGEFV